MTPFEFVEPATLSDAIALIDPDDPTVRPMSGGTALMLMMKAGVFAPSRLVSLGKLGDEFTRIAPKPDGSLEIGAMATMTMLEHSPQVARHAPVIPRTMKRLSNVRVRNVATVGGNLAHGDPHMDLPPVLIALGASVDIAGPGGERTLRVEDLLTGYYETALARNELIVSLTIPPQGSARTAYMKVTTGSADDWPALGVAVSLDMDGAAVKSARVVASAATPMAIRLKGAENLLAGKTIDDALLKAAGDAACDEAETVADVRGSSTYKRELLRVYVGRALRIAAAQNGAGKP